MKLLSASILSGANVYRGKSVIRQEVDLGSFAGMRSCEAGSDFADRLLDRFQGLGSLTAGAAIPDDFINRLKSAEGAPFVEVLFYSILAVEAAMTCTMRYLDGIKFAKFIVESLG